MDIYLLSILIDLGFSKGFKVSRITLISSLTSFNVSCEFTKSFNVSQIKLMPLIFRQPFGNPENILNNLLIF